MKRVHGIECRDDVCISAVGGANVFIGENVFFNRRCLIASHYKVEIGNNCKFGPNICVYDHDHEFNHSGIFGTFKTDEVIIGDGCWIGAGAIILKGTHIGDASVIAAGTVVRGSIPPHSLVYQDKKMIIKEIE
jgi:acetyltransferase-like isoleucine patch superfamily enzyme